jgi:hypothetical protein
LARQRLEPKGFRQRRPNDNGGWIWNLDGVCRVLYRLPELLQYPDGAIFVCEGEKDADRVASLGHCATTVASGKWADECVQALAGRDILILEDNDKAGREKASEAASLLHGKAKTVRVVRLPGLPERGDVSDWLDAGHSGDEMVKTCFDTPIWEPDSPSTDRAPLLLRSWLDRVLPPRDYLLGEVLCTTSRWLIYGATGVGKTLFSAEMAGAISSGSQFLNWSARRPARVMYLDGELPAETLKERMQLVAEQFGADIPLYGYSRDVLGPDDMPPLNTEEGERWLENEIEAVKPDAIYFDSVMSLTIGNMSDEESWSPLKPLIRRLSARRIAQIWLHHTGHDTSKGYGTKTREWELDTVLALTPAGDDGATIQADFTKARLRNPNNRDQFKARNLTRSPDGWTAVDADISRKPGSRTTEAAQVQKAILQAYDQLADGINLVPGFDNKPVRKVAADAVRDEVKSRGFLDAGEKGALTSTARGIFRRAKSSLLSAELLIEDDGLMWRP